MTNQTPVKVFIGSGEASRIEQKVLIYSLHRNSQRDLDIWVYNGTHNAIERNTDEPFLAPLSLKLKYRSRTEFSLFRYLIPELCNFEGRAIYLDSDIICLCDIGELFDTEINGFDFLAVPGYDKDKWASSVMLIDCSQCHFELELYYQNIDQRKYSYFDFSRFSPLFLSHHDLKIGKLDSNWNVFDRCDEQTKLIHYTNLFQQPWKYPGHPYGNLWFEYLQNARDEGYVTDEDIELSILRSYI
ncbi:UNVERIFIED_CONTAM: glycosyl transferase, partial [Euhalothece sp. KZN 001]